MRLLTFSGFRGSGKDRAVNYLGINYLYQRLAFADILKEHVSKMYNIPMNLLLDSKYKETPLLNLPVNTTDSFVKTIHELLKDEFVTYENRLFWTPRALLILEGSIKRSVDSNYWINKVIDKIKNTDSNLQLFAVSDLRYKNEYFKLKKEFGDNMVSIRINRYDNVNTNDPSENDLNDHEFDYVIDNKGTIEEFYKKLDDLMEVINKK